MKDNLVWKKFEIFWPEILHFKRVKMSETPCISLFRQHNLSVQMSGREMIYVEEGIATDDDGVVGKEK